ncbi:MAG: hypothetical protein IPJ40_12180 [Saprospirales bacterium]|nr:hypothetical protein [Saprospirales bacterium]
MIFSLSFNEEEEDYSDFFTDIGKYLWETSFEDLILERTEGFLLTILDEEAGKVVNSFLAKIQKRGKPQKPWVVPFSTTGDIAPSSKAHVRAKSVDEIKQEFNKKIQLDQT